MYKYGIAPPVALAAIVTVSPSATVVALRNEVFVSSAPSIQSTLKLFDLVVSRLSLMITLTSYSPTFWGVNI